MVKKKDPGPRIGLGRLGEGFAAGVLEMEGMQVLARNFRCPAGELDLVCEENGTIWFIEVKTRRSLSMGRPAESVNREKQRRIRRAADWFLQSRGMTDRAVGFMVFEVLVNEIRAEMA